MDIANKTHLFNSVSVAFFLSSIFGLYAFGFWMGSIFIYNDVQNTLYGVTYTAGHVMSCFFGVNFGMFALGASSPSIKAIAEGKAAGKSAFEVIDRQPDIDIYDPKAKNV